MMERRELAHLITAVFGLIITLPYGYTSIQTVNQIGDGPTAKVAPRQGTEKRVVKEFPGTTLRLCKAFANSDISSANNHTDSQAVNQSLSDRLLSSNGTISTTVTSNLLQPGNETSDPSEGFTVYNTTPVEITFDLGWVMSQRYSSLAPVRSGVQFYMRIPKPEEYKDDLVTYGLVKVFKRVLQIPDYVGIHQVTLQPNNASVKQLEDALTAAWSQRFQNVSPAIQVEVEIVLIDNGTGLVTAKGLPLMRIVYVLPLRSTIGMQLPSVYTNNQLPQIIPPSVQVLRKNLQSAGLILYDDIAFEGYGAYSFYKPTDQSSSFDPETLKTEILDMMNETRGQEGCANADSKDLDIRFGNADPYIITSRANNSFSYSTLINVPYVALIQDAVYLGQLPDAASHPKYGQHYYQPHYYDPGDRSFYNGSLPFPVDKSFSFRMYFNKKNARMNFPVSIQHLPLLESRMTERVRELVNDDKQRMEVVLWNPDLVGNRVNFFVALYYHGKTFETNIYADPKLRYAQSIYDRLQGLTIEMPLGSGNSTLTYVLERYPFGDTDKSLSDEDLEKHYKSTKRDIVNACRVSSDPFICPVNDTFLLTVQLISEALITGEDGSKTAAVVNSSHVLRAVELAFAAANPITINDAILTITLTGREDVVTVAGDNAVRFQFAASYPGIDTQKYWKVWRYPSTDVIDGYLKEMAAVRLTTAWTLQI
ncbi:uncharacterized protein LOC129600354 [Paramacrobiotus metropolitanus]|uniref:uncharacterized protein LOC129600354 n=1 Tax=Paramacrobiotus metropolitanus TaxID=2943436 RepID=UPI002445FEFC|nr:uncharacterized protein LOC129600354 [Paramacrobiotus metropolitanus]